MRRVDPSAASLSGAWAALPSALRRRQGWLLLAPFGLGAAYVVLLTIHFGGIVAGIYRTPDYASGPVIGELFSEAHGTRVVLGDNPWYTSLWFELLTRWAPFYRDLWQVAPWIGSLVAIAIVAWATARVGGRAAGWLVAFVCVCAGPQPLLYEFGWTQHGPTLLPACLLDGFLVFLVGRGGMVGRRSLHVLACAFVAAAAAAGAASDKLLFVSGILPFVLSGLVVAAVARGRLGRRLASTVIAISLLAYAGSRIVIAAMEARNVYPTSFPIAFATWPELGHNPGSILEGLAKLFNGDFGGAGVGARSVLALACAFVLAAALVVVGRTARSSWIELGDRLWRGRAPALPFEAARTAHILFWLLALAIPVAALELADITNALSASRYLLTSAYGIAAIVAVAMSRAGAARYALAVGGACVVVSAAVVSLAAGDLSANANYLPAGSFARTLQEFASSDGLAFGYALYYDAPTITWETHTQLQVYPVWPCSAPSGLCVYAYHRLDVWYIPRPGAKTFLLIDPRYGPATSTVHLPGLVDTVDLDNYHLMIFDYDIAADLGPPVAGPR